MSAKEFEDKELEPLRDFIKRVTKENSKENSKITRAITEKTAMGNTLKEDILEVTAPTLRQAKSTFNEMWKDRNK